ncbi:peptidoglycan-binding protein [Clostridium sp. DJ247]|nr:peptidoglycan-binding protein [Clostridium sp. DJ247]
MLSGDSLAVRQVTGTLIVFAFVGDQASPIAGAKVSVRDMSGNLIATRQTNESGQTEAIRLESVEKRLSLTPADVEPYSKYNVMVEAAGYVTVEIKGVQIFADTESIQQIELTRAERTYSRQVVQEFNISEHELVRGEVKLKEEEIEKVVPTQFFFLLQGDPVVPSHVIVHDGHPNNASRPKYTVDFKTYIKNVACSEIYPTWPIEAIKANVVCIISFTLNRVYTEFYRSKGKDFTITSSTAFDHKYIHNRNIYANISNVVDSIFTEYIKNPNPEIDAPFLSQYCDGRRVKCPGWLTQWGSKSRADLGENYLQILKYFYGSEFEVKRAKQVQGIPESFPGSNLQIGSSGKDVETIQTYLNRISKNYPAIQKLPVDSLFGAKTQDQVKRFQRIFRLPQTGIVDYATWYKISDIYVAVTKLAEGPAGGQRTSISAFTNSLSLNERYAYAPHVTWVPMWVPVIQCWKRRYWK